MSSFLRPWRRAALAACLALTTWAAHAEDFSACLPTLRDEAMRAGVSRPGWDRLTAKLAPDLGVVALLDDQPEFKTPVWDYLAALVDDERVADGRARLAEWRAAQTAQVAEHPKDDQ